MRVSVSGKKIEVGQSLIEHVEGELSKSVQKYFDKAIDAEVVFSKEKNHLFKVVMKINEGVKNGTYIRSSAEESDVYKCFDSALDRAVKQLRRYNRRLKNHNREDDEKRFENATATATKYVISEAENDKASDAEEGPLIIAEKNTELPTLTVGDAVMHMNLAHLPALMFINKKSGNINVVYHREDGHISWVEAVNNQKNAA